MRCPNVSFLRWPQCDGGRADRPAIFSAMNTNSTLSSSHIRLKYFRSSPKTRAPFFAWLALPCLLESTANLVSWARSRSSKGTDGWGFRARRQFARGCPVWGWRAHAPARRFYSAANRISALNQLARSSLRCVQPVGEHQC